jgi:glutamate carboxypeptidase
MARQIIAIDGMTSDDCTFSVGIVHGGQWVNCVATTCTGEALSMAKRQADLDCGVELPHGSAGGGSDANFTGAMGIPTLDGLGVRGADAHTLNEHIEVDSLAERGRLMAALLATLD